MILSRSYNFKVKYVPSNITIKNYKTKSNLKGFKVNAVRCAKGQAKTEDMQKQFEKSSLRATQKVFDLVACNINKHKSFDGDSCTHKFLTLTFKDNIQDFKTANRQFTLFNQRLSYYLYKVNKNVLKYICVPELQKRGAIHYHVIYFNLPFIKFSELLPIWKDNTQGGAYIESIDKSKDGKEINNIAKYVCKYINKKNSKDEDSFEVWLEKGMLNQKRYFTSRGLYKPLEQDYYLENGQKDFVLSVLEEEKTLSKIYDNEYIGQVEINQYKINRQQEEELKKCLEIFNNNNNLKCGYKTTYAKKYQYENMIADRILIAKKLNMELEKNEALIVRNRRRLELINSLSPIQKMDKYIKAYNSIKEKKANNIIKIDENVRI